MSKLIDDIPEEKRSAFLSELLEIYVDNQGLGAMPKQDLDALILHLYIKHTDATYDPFQLSTSFKVRESKIKSLRTLGSVKFGDENELNNWIKLISAIKNAKFDIASKERGDIRFKLTDPSYYRYLQNRARKFGPCSYSPSSEAVTISLRTFFDLLDDVRTALDSEKPIGHEQTSEEINSIFQTIGTTLSINSVEDLNSTSTSFKEALTHGASLAGIGSFIKEFIPALAA